MTMAGSRTSSDTNPDQTDYDTIIAGGGLVGASLARALGGFRDESNGNNKFKIAVIESFAFNTEQQPSFDSRTVALSYSSKEIFNSLGLWSGIEELGACPIKTIHISDQGHIGLSHLCANEQDTDALGYVVENRVIGRVLYNKLAELDNVSLFCPASLQAFKSSGRAMAVKITQGRQQQTLYTDLLVAADGGESVVRKQAAVAAYKWGYDQTAITTNVACDQPHHHVAYERFTDTGPLALLPLTDTMDTPNRYSLVWTVNADQVDAMLAQNDTHFLASLQQRFGDRAGRFIKVGQRHAYPLSLLRAKESVQAHLAIIGNAAHLVHPVGGQGFNLGLRDVAALAQVVVDARRQGKDIGSLNVLNNYARWRRRDLLQTTLATDSLVRLFSTTFPPIQLVRNISLLAMDTLPGLKKKIARQAMGYVGKVSRLARGLPL